MGRRRAIALFLLVIGPLCFFESAAQEKPVWWADAERVAEEEGYGLLDHEEFTEILSRKDALLIDVRPDYEFQTGHLPGAINLEFDLGDRTDLTSDKQEELREILGPDLKRPIVIYCRSFR